MSARHAGITCDSCSQTEFRLRRYKCLICGDYDLCGTCYDRQRETNDHLRSHPMQCLIPKDDHGLFYSGEPSSNYNAKSFTCPLCGQLGFSEQSLSKHIFQTHPSQEAPGTEVICPLCVTQPTGEPNRKTRQLARHLATVHHLSTSAADVRQNDASPVDSLVDPPTATSSTATPTAGRRFVTLLPSTRRSVEPRGNNRSRAYTTLINGTPSLSSPSTSHSSHQRSNAYRAVLDMLNDAGPPNRRTSNRLAFLSRTNAGMNSHNQCNNAEGSGRNRDATNLFPPVPPPPVASGQTSRPAVSSADTVHCDYDDDDDDDDDGGGGEDDESDENYNEAGREEKSSRVVVDQLISVPSVSTTDDVTVICHPIPRTHNTTATTDSTTVSDRSDTFSKVRKGGAAGESGVTGKIDASPPTTYGPSTGELCHEEFDTAYSHFLGELVWSSLWLTEDNGKN